MEYSQSSPPPPPSSSTNRRLRRRHNNSNDNNIATTTTKKNGGAHQHNYYDNNSSTNDNKYHFIISKPQTCLLLLLIFITWLYISYLVYSKFDNNTNYNHSSSLSLSSLLLLQQRSATTSTATKLLTNHNDNNDNNDNSPTKYPTTTTITTQTTTTYEPTAKNKRWRIKEAKRISHENTLYWKDHVPDPIPPLSTTTNDNNNEEEGLPPVIAYVTTLTKCGPKHRGGLDGAAILLHSIRRNSYGWKTLSPPSSEDATNTSTNKRPQYGGNGGRYRYRAYVIVDPAASPTNPRKNGECARYLQKLGWIVLHRPPLVPLFPPPENENDDNSTKAETTTETEYHDNETVYNQLLNSGYVGSTRPKNGPTSLKRGEHPNKLRLMMHNDGCCGYTELLKLHVYGFIQHPLAVHLDFDSLLLQPMDDLFDIMLGVGTEEERTTKLSSIMQSTPKLPRTKNVNVSKSINAAFTRDYNSINHPSLQTSVGYQGGFLVVKPSLNVLESYRTNILQRGEFVLNPRKGWGGLHGGYYGDVTFQGILPYYYEHVAPTIENVDHNEIELNRCIYNQMADNPYKSSYKFPRGTPLEPNEMGFHDTNVCRDGRQDCSDTNCQLVHPSESITTHYTFCKKPWDCSEGNPGTVGMGTCLGLLREWYGVRNELEDWWLYLGSSSNSNNVKGEEVANYWKDSTITKVLQSRSGTLNYTQYFGYCDRVGTDGYRRLVEPDEIKSSR